MRRRTSLNITTTCRTLRRLSQTGCLSLTMNYLIYGRGKARQGKARQGKARQGKARQGKESTSFGRSIKTDCSCHRVGGWVAVKSGSLWRKAGSKQCQNSLFIAKMSEWSAPTLSPTPDRHFAVSWPV